MRIWEKKLLNIMVVKTDDKLFKTLPRWLKTCLGISIAGQNKKIYTVGASKTVQVGILKHNIVDKLFYFNK